MRERAYLYIQRKIAARELRGGTPISELPICKELGISRTPTREALRQLITEGLLKEIPGRGAAVVQLTRQDLVELYELREALESFAVQKVARQSVPTSEIQRLQNLADEVLALKNKLDRSGKANLNAEEMNQFEAFDIGFHTLLMRIAGNNRSLKAVNETRLLIRIFTTRHVGHSTSSLDRIYGEHCEILRGIAERHSERALWAITKHIQESQQERLEEYDHWEREASLKDSVNLVFNGQC
jgi:DNA-binding GntR family transcriptional regulator